MSEDIITAGTPDHIWCYRQRHETDRYRKNRL